MKIRWQRKRAAAAAALGVLLACLLAVSPVLAITWGGVDTNNTYRSTGAFLVTLAGRDGYASVCSGTLVHEQVYLTAGHCTSFIEELMDAGTVTGVFVSFEVDLSADPLTVYPVEEVITHPDYNDFVGQNNPYDLGALVLSDPVTGITPAALPDEGFLDELLAAGELRQGKEEADFLVVGYGNTLDWPPPQINDNDLKRYAFSEYQALLKAWLRMSQNQATGDGGTCYGDSGGPTFWDTGSGLVLVGVTSWGDANCVSTGFAYRVDIPEALGFIEDVIAGVE